MVLQYVFSITILCVNAPKFSRDVHQKIGQLKRYVRQCCVSVLLALTRIALIAVLPDHCTFTRHALSLAKNKPNSIAIPPCLDVGRIHLAVVI